MYTEKIVDTHVHLWDINLLQYPWLEGQDYLNRTFTVEDYKNDTKNLNIEKMIFVECDVKKNLYLDEVDYITNIAKTNDSRIAGIVCFVPLEKGECIEAEIVKLKKNPLIKGIRRMIQYETDMEFCLKADFIKGVKLLSQYNLTFDITIDYRQFKNTIKFVEKIGTDVKMILDHFGKPNIKEGNFKNWSEEIGILAQFPNVYCKLSSLPSEADWEKWTKKQLKPYAQRVMETFGIHKTIFGGDWPPVQRAASYYECVEMTEEFLCGCSKEDLHKVFYSNAMNFYNL